jgi:ABC-2 type transport system ATP-binding protein
MLVEVDGLVKEFGDVRALDGVDLSVAEGEVYGFLGPNGAGKSTTINVMLDFTKPDEGEVSVFGMDAGEQSLAIRRRTGCLLEGYGAYPRLTAREHLEHAIATKDADEYPEDLLERVDLLEAADREAGTYSKGMTQRMAIAIALVGDPDLLVLDEPTTGLDPNGARMLQDVVRDVADDGTTVFFSSHILEQVEAVADRIGILLEGEVVAEGDVDDMRAELGVGTRLSIDVDDVPGSLPGSLRTMAGVEAVSTDEDAIDVRCDGDGDTKLRVLNAVADAGVFRDFDVREASLGDVFSRHTKGTRTGDDPGARRARR